MSLTMITSSGNTVFWKCIVVTTFTVLLSKYISHRGVAASLKNTKVARCNASEFTEGYICYPKYSIKMPRREAWTRCATQNLTLVKIYGSLLHNKLGEVLLPSQTVWIGARRVENGWYWDDGERVSFSEWGKPISASGNCAVFSAGKWLQTECNEKHGFVCGPGGSHDMEAWTRCSFLNHYRHRPLADGCYWVYGEIATWDAGRRTCQRNNGELAVITDSKTNEAVMNPGGFAMQGEFQTSKSEWRLWAGARKYGASEWKRVTGEKGIGWEAPWEINAAVLSFLINTFRKTDTCLKIDRSGWKEDDCDEMHLFLCRNNYLPAYSPAINVTTDMDTPRSAIIPPSTEEKKGRKHSREEKKRRKHSRVYRRRPNGCIPGQPLAERKYSTVTMCAHVCQRRTDCQCFNYNIVTDNCRLFGELDISKAIPNDDFEIWSLV